MSRNLERDLGPVIEAVMRALSGLIPRPVSVGELPRDDRTLRWIEAGQGEPVVIFDAALGEPGTLAWAAALPAISAAVRSVAYDRAGIGISDPAEDMADFAGELDDLIAIAEAVSGRSQCVIVGHSWGGLLGLLAAIRRPDLVGGLVLVDPADETDQAALDSESVQEQTDFLERVPRAFDEKILSRLIDETFQGFAWRLTSSAKLKSEILAAYQACYSQRWQARMPVTEWTFVRSAIEPIHAIRSAGQPPDIPAVVITSTTGLPIERQRMWQVRHAEMAAGFPRGRHVVLERTGHAINQDRPDVIVTAVRDVIAAMPAG